MSAYRRSPSPPAARANGGPAPAGDAPPPSTAWEDRPRDNKGPPPPRNGNSSGWDDRDRRRPPPSASGGPRDDRRASGGAAGEGAPSRGYGPSSGGGRGSYGYSRRGSRSPDYEDRHQKRRRSTSPPSRRDNFRDRPPHDGHGSRDYPPSSRRNSDSRGYSRSNTYRDAPPPPPSQPIDAPDTLSYQVTFRYFTDWLRQAQPEVAQSVDAVDAAWLRYRSNYLRKGATGFFDEMKDQCWFKEKYSPAQDMEELRATLKKKGREGRVETFLSDLETGRLQELSYDYEERPPRGSISKNGDEKRVKQEDEEMIVDGEGDDRSRSPDLARRPPNPDLTALDPEPLQLFIKTIIPDVSRHALEQHCKIVPGFDYLALSDPTAGKKFHRVGWVNFKSPSDVDEALKVLPESRIDDFVLHMAPVDKPFTVRIRAAPSLVSSSERLPKDLDQIRRVVNAFEKDAGDSRGSVAIEEHHAAELAKVEANKEKLSTNEYNEAFDSVIKKTLDLFLYYLRSAFHTCYYCTASYNFPEELQRKCPKHVRRAAADASARIVTGKPNELAWLRALDDRLPLLMDRELLDPRDFGGESYAELFDEMCNKHILPEDGGTKFRCSDCNKLFSARKFVQKHLMTKHSSTLDLAALDRVKYFNNYVLDPAHLPLTDKLDNFTNTSLREWHSGPTGSSSTPSGGGGGLSDRLEDSRGFKRRREEAPDAPRGPPPPPPEGAALDPRARLGAASYADLDGPPGAAADIVLQY